ncbi:MAG: aminoglycoside phosphotransferase family protein [Clostridia bacterium]|nr:aminoglycoside phosphotransferase family protein [Clostridia bacterium]
MQTEHSPLSMCRLFSIPDLDWACESFGHGHINETYLVSSPAHAESYILQRVSPAAFHHPEQVMENMARVTKHLGQVIARRGGDPYRECLSIVPLKTGEIFTLAADGAAWRMTRNITGTVSFELPDTDDVFEKTGQAFGTFQRDLMDFPAATLHETIPHFHDTPDRLRLFREALEKDICKRAEGAEDLIRDYLARADRADALTAPLSAGKLPLRVTHNDTKLNNVLFDEVSRTPVCVVDLDTVMPGLSAYDFGDAIRFGASTALEDERDPEKIRFSFPMFAAFARGYLQALDGAVTPAEADSLPVGAWMMTYECGMRFLTDYLSGDTYFHTAYPEHNLVRAKNQMTLLQDMEHYADEMLSCVRSLIA